MRWNRTTLFWILVAVVLVPIGITRIRLALASTEERVEATIVALLDSLEDREPRRVRRILSHDFVDVETGYGRSEVVDAAKISLRPGERYRATLDPTDGLEFLENVDGERVTVRVHALIEVGTGETFRPYWDMVATLDLEMDGGAWRVFRSQDVSHGRRPQR